jgi:protein-L-isoaspartate(D-aspartate) O-methyltransferase
MQNRSENLRTFFARYVTAVGGVPGGPIERAFAATPRETFSGPGPWSVNVPGSGYVETPDDDLAFLYQDTLIALDPKRGINIGQPSAHARWLGALRLREGETVLQVGAGTGYYTAILAHLVGDSGRVHAYEIEPDLAARAIANLRNAPHAEVQARSGIGDGLPKVDAVYVCAGITQPAWAWLDALRPEGRLVFPLQAERGFGGMLMITRAKHGAIWPARFISRAAFIPCSGPQDAETGRRLTDAFSGGGFETVRSFRLDEPIDATCWFAGDGWWLSTLACASPG